jgi:hypothetical protein
MSVYRSEAGGRRGQVAKPETVLPGLLGPGAQRGKIDEAETAFSGEIAGKARPMKGRHDRAAAPDQLLDQEKRGIDAAATGIDRVRKQDQALPAVKV